MSGVKDIGDDDNFSDDGFEALPDNALYELEQNAILSTQQVQQLQKQSIARPNTLSKGERPFDRTVSTTNYNADPTRSINGRAHSVGVPAHFRNSSEDQFLDDSNLPTPTEEKVSFLPQSHHDEVAGREHFRMQRFGATIAPSFPQPRPNYQHSQTVHNRSQYGQPGSHGVDGTDMLPSNGDRAEPDQGGIAQALRAQIQELLLERDKLTKDLHAANSSVQTQRGEISIIRANQAKASRTYDRQLAALKKAAEEEAAKHKAEVEAAREESERVATENRFLQQDLAEEAKKAKEIRHNLRTKPDDNNNSPLSTPKKTRTLAYRDGFDDDDIRMVSPSKGARKSKKTTPTAGHKRKRQALMDSPVAPLVLETRGGDFAASHVAADQPPQETVLPSHALELERTRGLKFLQRVYNFHPSGGEETVLEVFTQYSFPSEPRRKLSTIVIEGSSSLRGEDLPVKFARIIISLWAQALKEKYFAPVFIFIDLIRFILALDSAKTAPALVADLLPILQESGKINAIPRFQHSPIFRSGPGRLKLTPKSSLTPEVNCTDCLELLLDIAYACLHSNDCIDLFWQHMDYEFILIMLNSSQPIPDITLNISLLSTSIRPTTFGVIKPLADSQSNIEKHCIERLTFLLWEIPRVDEGEEPYSSEQISQFRVEVMSLLCELGLSSLHPHETNGSHGSQLLAEHPAAIGRLVRSIYDEMTALYSPEPLRDTHSTLVNDGVRLFYRLLELHGNDINLHQKLEAVNGGVQKHAVVLTRLAFKDGPLMEELITDETCIMAHEMLEQVITPEEAEALLDVFPTQKSRR
ncbi:putative dna repair protein rad26 [Phaeomoniella chlamydospora]|uniref:Putative dna repair protein rad26 n=1 Tax=Phaeomoniella chlamydospora TaxID=158046 RepID=A0A0G2EG98_PHACM|nr:putative dna repair protein rad26 [Phaeomoniella chlamydospora]